MKGFGLDTDNVPELPAVGFAVKVKEVSVFILTLDVVASIYKGYFGLLSILVDK